MEIYEIDEALAKIAALLVNHEQRIIEIEQHIRRQEQQREQWRQSFLSRKEWEDTQPRTQDDWGDG